MKEIGEEFSTADRERPLTVADLFFIIGVEEDLRFFTFDRRSSADAVPCEIDYQEIEGRRKEGRGASGTQEISKARS